MVEPLLRIAVPSPLRRFFDYLPPAQVAPSALAPGIRVKVPFGPRSVVGVLVEVVHESELPVSRLKRAADVLDENPLWGETEMRLLRWAADYYHHPPGEVFQTALPVRLRQGRPAAVEGSCRWRVTRQGESVEPAALGAAPKQAALLQRLQGAHEGLDTEVLNRGFETWRPSMARLVEKGWAERVEGPCLPVADHGPAKAAPELNAAQSAAVEAVGAALDTFGVFFLDGVTGSGKTEVYLALVEQVLARGRQVMILVPEIGLTSQLITRFRRRFPVPIAILHSGLADGERLCGWLAARDGSAPLVIGTRSAVFVPFKDLGLIVVDEEHDASFKQQDGFRYSARDAAVMRASMQAVPVVLGSATPSIETLHNARQGRYRHLILPERAGSAVHPAIHLVDVRHLRLEDGLSAPLRTAIGRHLAADGQVLIFLNRRGFAPTLLCHECGWQSGCDRCDARMVFYASSARQRCHHCGADRPVPVGCPDCGSAELRPLGQGTERVEAALRQAFPQTPLVRIDRDTTRRKGSMDDLLGEVRSGRARLLVGTQMLAKGHHFPEVTLVAVLNADWGLFSADFRAGERLIQLITQVAGRAGRAERPGEVLIQTEFPEHPLLTGLLAHDYGALAGMLVDERQVAELPPFTHLALLRAEAVDGEAPLAFLRQAREIAAGLDPRGVDLWEPVPAPMERRAGRVRAQLLLQARQRAPLHRLLDAWLPKLESLKSARRVRWSLDVDPVELF